MAPSRITEPGVLERIDFDAPEPEPTDCLPAGETPVATVPLRSGWIAVTDREILCYRPDRDPSLVRTARCNVTSVSLRRTGGRRFLGYVPVALLYAVVAFGTGALLIMVSPGDVVAVPDAPGTGGVETIVRTLGWASRLLGTVLLFTAILVGLCVAAVVGYWFFSREVAVVLERGSADPIECPTDRQAGRRAIRTLRETFPE